MGCLEPVYTKPIQLSRVRDACRQRMCGIYERSLQKAGWRLFAPILRRAVVVFRKGRREKHNLESFIQQELQELVIIICHPSQSRTTERCNGEEGYPDDALSMHFDYVVS